MLHEFRLINVRSENNETISFVYGAKSFRSHWNVGAVYIAPKITIAGNMENEKGMESGTTSEYFDSRVSVILVRAKSRVAPLKPLSIPRLELMACCVGARLINSILKALNMPDLKVTLWSDSTTALGWIKEYGNWSVFVANRVKEIRQRTQIQSWKYVLGNMNIADLLSRGCSPRQMLNSRWWEGPSWLKQNSEYWPDGEISCEPQEVNVERKKTKNANVDLANDAPPCLYVMCLIMIK
ncbi:DUF1758 domain-containing protein [Trichonephila clavipes]|uniref:DUF1758 domain-containing protein n=1 Tax=Trichonephila clavipes TaxID=2585209 RepID=A0A8X6WDT0_TRICX|nr:DUF1758 domain-containing protein [Trichonephila clavipes]